MPSWFWWCVLSGRYLLLIDLWNRVGVPGRVCRTFWPWLAELAMGDSYYEGPLKSYAGDYYCMRSSNDNNLEEPVGTSSLGWWTLTLNLDVFGLWANIFDTRANISDVSRTVPQSAPCAGTGCGGNSSGLS